MTDPPRPKLSPWASIRLNAQLAAWLDGHPRGRTATLRDVLERYAWIIDQARPLPLSPAEAVVLLLCCGPKDWHPGNLVRLPVHVTVQAPAYGGDPKLGQALARWSPAQLCALADSLELYAAREWTPDQSLTERARIVGLTKG